MRALLEQKLHEIIKNKKKGGQVATNDGNACARQEEFGELEPWEWH